MNVTRTSFVKVMGHQINVPNCLIRERKPWSTEKKNRARDRAARLGELQTFVSNSPVAPTVGLLGFIGAIGVVGNLIESIKL
jgi:hypothetical protein